MSSITYITSKKIYIYFFENAAKQETIPLDGCAYQV